MFQLSLAVGCPHPDYLNNYLTSSQIAEWRAFDAISPIGGKRDDFHMAHLISTITNLATGIHGKKGAKLTKIDDFIIKWSGVETEDTTMSPESIKNLFLGLKKK